MVVQKSEGNRLAEVPHEKRLLAPPVGLHRRKTQNALKSPKIPYHMMPGNSSFQSDSPNPTRPPHPESRESCDISWAYSTAGFEPEPGHALAVLRDRFPHQPLLVCPADAWKKSWTCGHDVTLNQILSHEHVFFSTSFNFRLVSRALDNRFKLLALTSFPRRIEYLAPAVAW